MRRGYIVTWDALIALTIVLFLMLGFIGLHYFRRDPRSPTTFENIHSVGENALDTINKMGVLEEIGYYWSIGNTTHASDLAWTYLDPMMPKYMGYRLEIVEDDNVYTIYDSGSTSRPSEAGAFDQTRSFRLLSGYSKDSARITWVARSWLVQENWRDSNLVYTPAGVPMIGLTELEYFNIFNTTFYFMVPGAGSLSRAHFNLTWARGSTTTSTTTTSTSTTTTLSPPSGCRLCPSPIACDITSDGMWAGTKADEYNYHSFTIAAGDTCNLEVIIYTGVESNFAGTNLYDLYANWWNNEGGCGESCSGAGIYNNNCLCECQHPPSEPDTWFWDCEAINYGMQWVSCLTTLTAGTYEAMVDCWNLPGGPDWCPGQYYIYIRAHAGSDPGCPDHATPATVTTTTSTTTTSTTIAVVYPDGTACTDDGNCTSGHCAQDYDGSGMWCAPAGNCVHSSIATCDAACYGYGPTDFGPDCNSIIARWACNAGSWLADTCPICAGGAPKDAPCAGIWQCVIGTPATCSGGCTTNGGICDYCGSTTPGAAGSDTWYDAVCSNGVCGPGVAMNCLACSSCLIVSLVGGCNQTGGVNDYYMWPDFVAPNTCDGLYWCNETSECDIAPVCTEEVMDFDQDGVFETCGCSSCNGCTCDINGDSTADGVCVDDACNTTAPVALNCGIDGCNPADKTNVAYGINPMFPKAPLGWACDSSYESFTGSYFTQDGMHARDNMMVYVCANSTAYTHVCSNFMDYYAGGCGMICWDGDLCDTTFDDGDFNATATCSGGTCSGPPPLPPLVNADFSADGSCEREGCNSDCEGCLCDGDRDSQADGVCIGDECVKWSGIPVVDCGNTCDTGDVNNNAYNTCMGHGGLACIGNIGLIEAGTAWRYSYFPQDGLCASGFCDTWEEVCQNASGEYYDDCSFCADGSPCDIAMDGNFDAAYGTCKCGGCIPAGCSEEYVDTNQDGCTDTCGCSACNGCVCDQDWDGTLDGMCVDDVCVGQGNTVSMNCPCAKWKPAQVGCTVDSGWACDSDYLRPAQTYFNISGLCAEVDGSPECVKPFMASHICKSGGVHYDSCSDCSNGDPCDTNLTRGFFYAMDGQCSGGACVPYGAPPSEFDWRDVGGVNWVTPVKSQGGRGTCTAFAHIGRLEARYNIQESDPNLDIDLSEEHLWSCGTGIQGIPDEACLPYNTPDPCNNRCADWQSRLWNYTDSIGTSGETDTKNLLRLWGPLSTTMYATGMVQLPSGVWTCPNNMINHAIVMVGYNDTGGYWVIKNSWGTGWGDAGYAKIAYGNCSMKWSGGTYENIIPP
jgi:hypothetical protein